MKGKRVGWPKDFVLDEKKKQYAIKNGINPRQLNDFWELFHDYCIANESRYANWDAAFRMRVRHAKMYNQFQAPPKTKTAPQVNSNIKIRKAFDAMCMGGNIEDIAHRLKLNDYEQECVLMAFNGGAKRVKELANGIG